VKPEEQDFLRSHLEKSQTAFEDAIGNVDAAAWLAEPAPERWSIGLCAEHVAIVSGRVLALVQALAEKPEEPFNEAESERKDALVLQVAENQQKFQAPAAIHPVSRYNSPQAALADFVPVYQKLIDLVEQNPTWLRGRFQKHPILEKLDGYQWILAGSCHTLRHVAQIREIERQLVR
jgi:hypothetical protein